MSGKINPEKTKNQINIMVLVSGGGTNLEALLAAEKKGLLDPGKIILVVSDREGAYALKRAENYGIEILVLKPVLELKKPERRKEHSDRILEICRKKKIDLIVHAGFLSVLKGDIILKYSKKMINLHPSLLPAYGGQGMYGEKVHRAVLAAGEEESGCSVHFVNDEIDGGEIILQRKVPVFKDDTPDSLAERIHKEEHIAIVDALRKVLDTICL